MHSEFEKTPHWWSYKCGECRSHLVLTRRTVGLAQFGGEPHEPCLPLLVFNAFTKVKDDRDKWRALFAHVCATDLFELISTLSA